MSFRDFIRGRAGGTGGAGGAQSTALTEKKNFENQIKIDRNRGLPPQYFERSAGPEMAR